MTPRSRLNFSQNDEQKRITIRYIGDVDGQEIVNGIARYLETVGEVWLYDIIIDMRRFEGFVPFEELGRLAREWATIAHGRDMGRKVAIISQDPLVLARAKAYPATFPTRVIRIFAEMIDGENWIEGKETASEASADTPRAS